MMNKMIAAILATALVFAGVGFAGGMFYAKASVKTVAAGPGNWQVRVGGAPPAGMMPPDGAFPYGAGRRPGANGIRRMRGNFTVGKVIEKDAGSFTVKTTDSGSKTVYTSSSTSVDKYTEGSVADISVGATVTVIGESQSGGVKATRITVSGK